MANRARPDGHGRARSTDSARSSSNSSLKWRPTTCNPIGQPVERARRNRDRRVAVEVGGERQPAVVLCAGLDAAERRWQRAVGIERDVGVRRGDDEIDAVDRIEDAGHRLVELDSASFDLRPCLGVVQTFGGLHRRAHLRSQLVGAFGPQLAEPCAAVPIIPLIDHAAPMLGSLVSTSSTRVMPRVGDQAMSLLRRAAPT